MHPHLSHSLTLRALAYLLSYTYTCSLSESSIGRGLMEGMKQLAYNTAVKLILAALEHNLLPDFVTRRYGRFMAANILRSGYKSSSELQLSDLLHFAHCTLSLSLLPS